MINNIIEMLEVAKASKQVGYYTNIALGANKLPTSLKDAIKTIKLTAWQKN